MGARPRARWGSATGRARRRSVAAQRFVAPFSLGRMTWIKPSFLWMMEWSGWATKPEQEHVLAVRITRAGWEEALASARLSGQGAGDAPVVVQWDPERSVRRQARLPLDPGRPRACDRQSER